MDLKLRKKEYNQKYFETHKDQIYMRQRQKLQNICDDPILHQEYLKKIAIYRKNYYQDEDKRKKASLCSLKSLHKRKNMEALINLPFFNLILEN